MSLTDIAGGSGGIIFIILTILQIAPIEINPWSWIAKKFGNAINADIKEEIGSIKQDISKLSQDVQGIKDTNDERYAIQCRIRILRFNDELLINIEHTKDYYDQIMMDIDIYENYCSEHPEFKNNMTMFAVSNIKSCYEKCMTKHKFLL